jgi:hypothetical protein
MNRPSAGTIIAPIALVVALGGTADAAGVIHVGTRNIHNAAVTSVKIRDHAIVYDKLGRAVQLLLKQHQAGVTGTGAAGAAGPAGSGAVGPAGAKGDTGATGAVGPQGAKGDTGAAGAAGPAGASGAGAFESTESDTENVGLDPAPGPQGDAGTGGWGFDNATGDGVTTLTNGSTNTFDVGVLQYNDTADANGTITLSYDPYDFTLVGTPGDGTCTDHEANGDGYPIVSCDFTDLDHTASSKGFSFTADNDSPLAEIGVTVDTNGQQVTGQYPVSITG